MQDNLKYFKNLCFDYFQLLEANEVNYTQRNLFLFYVKSFLALFEQKENENNEIFEEEKIIPDTLLDTEEFDYFKSKILPLLGYIKEKIVIDDTAFDCLEVWKILIENFQENPSSFSKK